MVHNRSSSVSLKYKGRYAERSQNPDHFISTILNANFDFSVTVANDAAIETAKSVLPRKVVQGSPCPDMSTLTNENRCNIMKPIVVEHSYNIHSSGHLVLSHFGTCMCSNLQSFLNLSCLRTFEFRTSLGTSVLHLTPHQERGSKIPLKCPRFAIHDVACRFRRPSLNVLIDYFPHSCVKCEK